MPPIVYVTEYYPPFGAGGAERTAALHAGILTRRGQPVLVLTPNYGAAEREAQGGVEVIRFPFERLAGAGHQVSPFRFLSPGYHRYLASQILRSLNGCQVRCLHAQNSHSIPGAARAARRLGVPLITHVRDTAGICGIGALCLMEPGRDEPPRRCGIGQHRACHSSRYLPAYQPHATPRQRVAAALYTAGSYADLLRRRRAHRGAARIAFASEGLRRLYRGLQGFEDEARHRVVHAPMIDAEECGPAGDSLPPAVAAAKREGAPLVLYIGKISKGKGAEMLAGAQRELARRVPQARLILAGHDQLQGWGFDPARTISLGFVEPRVRAALYDACDVVVLPSIWPEPLGWATLDAGRWAKPLVATRVGGVPEGVLDGETGVLVDKLDVRGFSDALAALLSDPGRRDAMGRRAHAFIRERFGEAAIGRELDALYHGI